MLDKLRGNRKENENILRIATTLKCGKSMKNVLFIHTNENKAVTTSS